MADGTGRDDDLAEWGRERRTLIQAAMDRDDTTAALALTLEGQFALGLQTLSAGGFPVKVTPAPQSTGVMPFREIERLVRKARAYLDAKAGGPTREDAAGLAAIEGVFHLRALIGRFPLGDANSKKLFLAIVLAAGRCGGADAVLAGERQGFFKDAAAHLSARGARSQHAHSANATRKWWRDVGRQEWLRLGTAEPSLSKKERENRVVSFLNTQACGRRCPKARGLKEARLREKWDATEP